jgi:GT2 family glycosyltransferase
MVSSIDRPVDRLCIVKNGKDPTVEAAIQEIIQTPGPYIKEVCVHSPFRNLGVAPSWNTIIKSFPECIYWMIANNDTVFLPGDLDKYHRLWQDNQGHVILDANGGFSCFIVDPDVITKLGLFDENIWPIYHEDIDYLIRMDRAGMQRIQIDSDMSNIYDGSWTVRSSVDYQLKNKITQESNRAYVAEKWGYDHTHQTPWNLDDRQVSDWSYSASRRRIHSKVWDNFAETAASHGRPTLAEIIARDNLHTDKESVHSYCSHFYENEFARYRDKPVQLLESGINEGGSLQLWAKWFTQASIMGIDLQLRGNCAEDCGRYPNIRIGLGDAYDITNIGNYPPIDILIDDGPHDVNSQLWALENLLPRIKPGGLFVIEDVMDSANLTILFDRVPEQFKPFAEMLDLRHVKGRYDDLMLIVRVPE